jgi:hypothetical protein
MRVLEMKLIILRIKDAASERREITIRFAKGGQDRRTLLSLTLVAQLKR